MNKPIFSPDLEYQTLRNELLQGKKYVFERPILIITGCFAIIQFIDKQYAIYFPLIIIGLLFFNLWFTVNRIGSMARIVGYIQYVLENKNINWHGWETSLRNYRKWLKKNNLENKNIDFNETAVYDNLGYYPTIYFMHIIITLIIFLALIIKAIFNYGFQNMIVSVMTFIVLILFLLYTLRNTPSKVKIGIEKNRQIWKYVYQDWETLDNESTISNKL